MNLLSNLILVRKGRLPMAVVINIDDTNPVFSGLDMKHISLVIGAVTQAPMFYNFKRRLGAIGETGTNNKILAVSKDFPLVFENEEFALLGTSKDPYSASRTLSLLLDYMRKGLLIVTKDGAPQSPTDILNFTP